MSVVNLEDAEWSQVIAIIAQSHPLIAKISTQLVAQKGNGNAAQREEGPREREPGEAFYKRPST